MYKELIYSTLPIVEQGAILKVGHKPFAFACRLAKKNTNQRLVRQIC